MHDVQAHDGMLDIQAHEGMFDIQAHGEKLDVQDYDGKLGIQADIMILIVGMCKYLSSNSLLVKIKLLAV